jgi:hypothetical protein
MDIVCSLELFADAVSNYEYIASNDLMMVNNELERILQKPAFLNVRWDIFMAHYR